MLQALEYVVSNAIPKAPRSPVIGSVARVVPPRWPWLGAAAGLHGLVCRFRAGQQSPFRHGGGDQRAKGDAYYGGAVATPPFAEAMGGVLQLFNIRPDAIPPEVPAVFARTRANNGAPRT